MKSNNKLTLALAISGLMVSGAANAVQYHFVMPMDGMIASSEPALPYSLHANGVTVQCEGMTAGETFELNGTNYTVAGSSEDAKAYGATACTSNITDMQVEFDLLGDGSMMVKTGIYVGEASIPDISSWDMSNVTNMEGFFSDASGSIPNLSYWDTSSVTNMKGIFNEVTSSIPDVSSWNTSNVTNMLSMFKGTDFNYDIGSWDTSNVTIMDNMFSSAYSFNQDLSGWCVSNITAMPSGFDMDATAWTLPDSRPVWGTCPAP